MRISKTPYRVSLFGGSCDYPSFYQKHGALLIGFAMNKYCYLSVRHTPKIFNHLTKVTYSVIETVNNNKDIRHNGVRGVLQYLHHSDTGYEINHICDLPAQTGIGSSSSFIVGLLNCLTYNSRPRELARSAIIVERELLQESGGIQDQIWAAYGGLNSIYIDQNGNFVVTPIPCHDNFYQELEARSFLIYTGRTRMSYQIALSHDNTSSNVENTKLQMQEIAIEGLKAFQNNDIDKIGCLLHDSWKLKRDISRLISNQKIDALYDELKEYGMIGGKLLGSGGSGFIFGITDSKESKDNVARKWRKDFITCGISKQGSTIIDNSE